LSISIRNSNINIETWASAFKTPAFQTPVSEVEAATIPWTHGISAFEIWTLTLETWISFFKNEYRYWEF
jgi:hypothetical protein